MGVQHRGVRRQLDRTARGRGHWFTRSVPCVVRVHRHHQVRLRTEGVELDQPLHESLGLLETRGDREMIQLQQDVRVARPELV